MLDQINIPAGGRVLDVGCGFGRHSLELARRGYCVVGIDPAPAMIAAARERATQAGVSVDFQVLTGEDFTSQQAIDAAICLFTTLGQIREEGDNWGLVDRVYQLLLPGGAFVVEVPQRTWVIQNLRTAERLGSGERYTDVWRSYDPEQNTLTETFTQISPQKKQTFLLRYRFFDQPELHALLEGAGFRRLTWFGSYAGVALDERSPILLVFARKVSSDETSTR